jgi:Transcriptional regulator
MLSFSHEVFIEVAKNLSFSKAAEALYISQPAITKHIQSLEKNYKVSLFERKGNSVALTAEGKILLEHLVKARELQRQLEFEITRQKICNWQRDRLRWAQVLLFRYM